MHSYQLVKAGVLVNMPALGRKKSGFHEIDSAIRRSAEIADASVRRKRTEMQQNAGGSLVEPIVKWCSHKCVKSEKLKGPGKQSSFYTMHVLDRFTVDHKSLE